MFRQGADTGNTDEAEQVLHNLRFVRCDIFLNFVQIGLTANSALFKDLVETNRMGEILTDKNGRTSVKGIYAAGDVTDISYKQIIIAMGEGAKAALAAFEDRMRGEVG